MWESWDGKLLFFFQSLGKRGRVGGGSADFACLPHRTKLGALLLSPFPTPPKENLKVVGVDESDVLQNYINLAKNIAKISGGVDETQTSYFFAVVVSSLKWVYLHFLSC